MGYTYIPITNHLQFPPLASPWGMNYYIILNPPIYYTCLLHINSRMSSVFNPQHGKFQYIYTYYTSKCEIFHELKASEMSRNISHETNVISDLSYTRQEMRTHSRALDNNCKVSRNISSYVRIWKILQDNYFIARSTIY